MTTILFDTETTGLIKPDVMDIAAQPYIIEIYMLKVDDNLQKIDELDMLIQPPIPITPEITKITGITEDMVKNEKPFSEAYKEISEFMLGVDTIVAHNLAFDRAMLANELTRINKIIKFPWPIKHICTVEKTIHLEQRRLTLSNLHKHLFDCDFENAHRAKNDVMAMYKCYKELRIMRIV